MWMDKQRHAGMGPTVYAESRSDRQDDKWMEAIVDTMIGRAVRDAHQHEDPALRDEASAWLWVCCPDLADQLDLPNPVATEMPDEVMAYSRRQRAA